MPFLLKRLLFRTHWLLGLVAGLVLALVGVTGALLSYEAELIAALNPQLRLEPAGRIALSPDALIARAAAAYPELDVRVFAAQRDPAAPVELRLGRGSERGGPRLLLDPYSGAELPSPRGSGFFETSEQLHRNLAVGPVGKQIVGASTVALIVLALSGVVLRWPRRWRSPRAWLRLDTALRGRSLWWHLHAVSATWLLAFYLLAASTGLWWSYAFYRNAINTMAGVPVPPPPTPTSAATPPPRHAPVSIDRAHAAFLAAAPQALRYSVVLPPDPEVPLEWRYFTAQAPHARAADTLRSSADGRVLAQQRYRELPRGRRFAASMLPLHNGEWFGAPGRLGMALASFAMPLFAITGIWLWLQRRRGAALARAAAGRPPGTAATVDILHASQSGTAERLAHQTAAWLRAIGLAPQVRPLAQWQPAGAAIPALFVVATYGEGDAPDAALGFTRRWLQHDAAADLSGLECGVLALGNRRYATFCGFGHALAAWLARSGARAWFETVESHEVEPQALLRWRAGLSRRWPALARAAPGAEPIESGLPAFAPWRLDQRRHLNPGSSAQPLCDLRLTPASTTMAAPWQPGDLLEVCVDGGAPRRYSLASLPTQRAARLLVRRWVGPDGAPGAVSQALCHELPIGVPLQARLRPALAFAPPEPERPALLVANGVGIAPFLALLARGDPAPRWLVYGERDPHADAALLEELEQERTAGRLARLDLAWSRGAPPRYVQHRLRESADEVRAWIARGAALRVCGSPEMGAAVDGLLLELLGEATVQALRADGRYRRELF